MKLISWNVNGLRAVLRKNFLDYLQQEKPDLFCLQETRCQPDEVDPVWPCDYSTWWNVAEKRGYAGTAIFSRHRPIRVWPGLGVPEHDREGRVLNAEFEDFLLVNVYVPNAQRELTRLAYRQTWDAAFLTHLKRLRKLKPVVFCGDFNVAPTEIDLTHPKANQHNHGFTPEERAGFAAYLKAGFVDTFRVFEPGPGHYTWWSQMGQARARNVGWRIDHALACSELRPRLRAAFLRPQVLGSDHCPVGLEFASSLDRA